MGQPNNQISSLIQNLQKGRFLTISFQEYSLHGKLLVEPKYWDKMSESEPLKIVENDTSRKPIFCDGIFIITEGEDVR